MFSGVVGEGEGVNVKAYASFVRSTHEALLPVGVAHVAHRRRRVRQLRVQFREGRAPASSASFAHLALSSTPSQFCTWPSLVQIWFLCRIES
jgi:hypothetical protein